MKLINSLSILFVLIFAGCGKSDKERQSGWHRDLQSRKLIRRLTRSL